MIAEMIWIMENNKESKDKIEYRIDRMDKGKVMMKVMANIAKLPNMKYIEDFVEIEKDRDRGVDFIERFRIMQR